MTSDNILHWRADENGNHHCYIYDSAVPNKVIEQWLRYNTSGYYELRFHQQGGDPVAEIKLANPSDAMMFKITFQN